MMDLINLNSGKSKFAFLIAFSYSLFSLILTQLSESDISFIQKTIISDQDEATGVFGKSYLSTYKSIQVLRLLGQNVPHQSKICRDLGYETNNPIKLEYVEINESLNCKHEFTNLEILNEENLQTLNLSSLYDRIIIANKINKKYDWNNIHNIILSFQEGDMFFSNVKNGHSNLASTVKVLHIFTIIHNDQTLGEELREVVKNQINSTFINMLKEFQLLREDLGYFADSSSLSLHLNSDIAQILGSINSIINIQNYDNLCLKLLNYFITFKYSMNNIDNIYYYVSAVNNFQNLPILMLEKNNFNYAEDKTIDLKIINSFGKDIDSFNLEISYLLIENQEKTEAPKKDSLDLEDENDSSVENHTTETFQNISKFKIDISKYVKKPVVYMAKINAKFSNKKKIYQFTYNFPIRSFSKIKINHLKMSVLNTSEKNDEKENLIEFPKRSFKNIKATQKTIIRLKININHAGAQKNKIEQLFLRLRHVEYGKSYSAYVREYKAQEDYYHISFDMSDPNVMDAYDGVYELTLILSDVTMDNPVIWNFGKIEVSFRKPLDPSNLSSNYKNIQKPKLEPFFEPEESTNKNLLGSMIFTGILGVCTFYFLIYLKTFNANIENFSKGNKSNSLFSILFILFILMTAYVLVLFFVKLNIVQTLCILGALSVPGVIITYKALSSITIEV